MEQFAIRVAPAAALLMRSAETSRGSLLLVGDVHAAKDRAGRTLPPLPAAGRELEAIRALAHGSTTVLRGAQAVESRFRREAPRARVVHFATHAVLDLERPSESFLALAGGDALTAREVDGLALQAGLVVLSACRGGSGTVSADGLLGLTRAFLLAGAASVIAPSWEIPDEPTVLLMAEFYRLYLSGVAPDKALRSAQLKLLAELRTGRIVAPTPAGPMVLPAHPLLWAGFVLQGAK